MCVQWSEKERTAVAATSVDEEGWSEKNIAWWRGNIFILSNVAKKKWVEWEKYEMEVRLNVVEAKIDIGRVENVVEKFFSFR